MKSVPIQDGLIYFDTYRYKQLPTSSEKSKSSNLTYFPYWLESESNQTTIIYRVQISQTYDRSHKLVQSLAA